MSWHILSFLCFFFFNDTATTEIYTLSLHDALPISDGRLAAAEARIAARATGLTAPRGSGGPAPGVTQREAVELLRAVGEGVGLLRVRADRLEATSLRHAWAQIDRGLRSGLVYAAWCQQA